MSAAEPAPGHPAVDFPVVVRNRMTKSRSYLLAEVIDGEPNAETRIERLRTFDGPAAERPPANTSHRLPADALPATTAPPLAARCTGWSRTREDPPAPRAHGLAGAGDRQRCLLPGTAGQGARTTTPSRCSSWPAGSASWTPSPASRWSTAAGWNSAKHASRTAPQPHPHRHPRPHPAAGRHGRASGRKCGTLWPWTSATRTAGGRDLFLDRPLGDRRCHFPARPVRNGGDHRRRAVRRRAAPTCSWWCSSPRRRHGSVTFWCSSCSNGA